MKTFKLLTVSISIALFSASAFAENACVFKANGLPQQTNDSNADANKLEENAQVSARDEARKACSAAGWSDCASATPILVRIVYNSVSEPFSLTIEYQSTVVSQECISLTQDARNAKKVELRGGNYVLIERAPKVVAKRPLDNDCLVNGKKNPGSTDPQETAPVNQVETDKKTESRNTQVAGDPYANGRYRN